MSAHKQKSKKFTVTDDWDEGPSNFKENRIVISILETRSHIGEVIDCGAAIIDGETFISMPLLEFITGDSAKGIIDEIEDGINELYEENEKAKLDEYNEPNPHDITVSLLNNVYKMNLEHKPC